MPGASLRLIASLPLVQLGPHDWQIGIDEAHRVVLAGVTATAAASLRHLDGHLAGPTDPDPDLVDALHGHGVLAPARRTRTRTGRTRPGDQATAVLLGRPDPDRTGSSVHVVGTGAGAGAIAVGLAAARVGTVVIDPDPRLVTADDLGAGGISGENVGSAWRDVVATDVRDAGASMTHAGAPDLVVLTRCIDADVPWFPPEWGDTWLSSGVAHLPVLVAGRSAQVGPLVTPGDGPCLHCVELHRCDADHAWPHIAHQVSRRPATPLATSDALRCAVVGLGLAVVIEYLDAVRSTSQPRTDAVGRILTWRLPGMVMSATDIARHPLCGCGW